MFQSIQRRRKAKTLEDGTREVESPIITTTTSTTATTGNRGINVDEKDKSSKYIKKRSSCPASPLRCPCQFYTRLVTRICTASCSNFYTFIRQITILLVLFLIAFEFRIQSTTLHHSSQYDLPIMIQSMNFTQIHDIGGYLYPAAKSFPSWSLVGSFHEDDEDDHGPDYGGLNLTFSSKASFGREIFMEDSSMDEQKEEYIYYKRYNTDDEEVCQSVIFEDLYFPNCNTFHEFDIGRDWDEDSIGESVTDYESKYISYGYYRDVWILDHKEPLKLPRSIAKGLGEVDKGKGTMDAMALKMLRLFEHNLKPKAFKTVQKDAIVMEQLTPSERIIDIYGHCSTSMGVELVENEIEEHIVPKGYMKQHELHDEKDVQPQNPFSPTEKLQIALQMAESIAELHGFKGGVIVHDDIQLCQWLRKASGKLKLGDFNRATIMQWNVKDKEYCKFSNGGGYGNYRSPEEFADGWLDEKIDVFSFGNNLYALLTGLWVFYENEDDEVVRGKLVDGETAFIDDRYQNRSYAEGKLVELIKLTWKYNPSHRIDIFDAVDFLKNALQENKRMK